MTYESDPPRLSELASDAPPELSRLFRDARRDVPNDAELGSLLGRLGPVLGAGAAAAGDALPSGAGSAPVAQGASSGLSLGKLLGALVSAGLVASGAAWYATRSGEPAPARAAVVQKPAPAAVIERAPEAPPAVAPEPEPAPAPALASAGSDARSAKRTAPAEGGDAVNREARLLEQARASIDSNPQRALSLTREHARRFPQGVLTQEREVIAIEALRRLDRGSEAKARADQFQKAYPGSAHQRALGTTPQEQ